MQVAQQAHDRPSLALVPLVHAVPAQIHAAPELVGALPGYARLNWRVLQSHAVAAMHAVPLRVDAQLQQEIREPGDTQIRAVLAWA